MAVPIRAALGVDQGGRSGWGLLTAGRGLVLPTPGAERFVDMGIVCPRDDFVARDLVVERALALVAPDPAALLVVFEDHSWMKASRFTVDDDERPEPGPTRTTKTILSMGGALERWYESLDRAGHPKACRLLVEPHDWRLRVHGVTTGSEDQLKGAAVRWAHERFGKLVFDHNVAEGLGLAVWGATDGVLVLGRVRADKRMKGRARRARQKQGRLPGIAE